MAHASSARAQDLRGVSLVYRFHGFHLDTARWELRDAHGARPALAPLPFRLLLLLIQQRARVLSKEELLTTLWHGIAVSEGSLTQAICTVRRALGGGESAHRWVQSVRGRGYRFVAPVEEIRASPAPEKAALHPLRHSAIRAIVARDPGGSEQELVRILASLEAALRQHLKVVEELSRVAARIPSGSAEAPSAIVRRRSLA